MLRRCAAGAAAIAGSTLAKNSLSEALTRSQGGLPSTTEKPPSQPQTSLSATSARARKMVGKARWGCRNLYCSASSRTVVSVVGSTVSGLSAILLRTPVVMGDAPLFLGATKAAHQASEWSL